MYVTVDDFIDLKKNIILQSFVFAMFMKANHLSVSNKPLPPYKSDPTHTIIKAVKIICKKIML